MSYKMKGFSGFKNSPLKQSSVLDPESGIPWASKKDYPKIDLGKASKNVNVTTGFGPEADKRMTSLVNKRTGVTKVSKKPVSKLGGVTKAFSNVPKQFAKNVVKFFGGKTLGVLGMLGSTSASADQPGTGIHGGTKVPKLRDIIKN